MLDAMLMVRLEIPSNCFLPIIIAHRVACFRQLFLTDHDAFVSKRRFMLCWESAGEMLAGLDHVCSLRQEWRMSTFSNCLWQ